LDDGDGGFSILAKRLLYDVLFSISRVMEHLQVEKLSISPMKARMKADSEEGSHI